MTKKLEIINEKGLHARAAAKLVELAEGFDARAELRHNDETAQADSIMGLLMLAAAKGTTIELSVSGPQSDDLAKAIENLIADRFGEAC